MMSVAVRGIILGLLALVPGSQARPEEPPRPLILVHDMPWFESKAISGAWGWHWTMGRLDPEKSDPTGRRSIASHFYPIIGPYDSADPDVLEYHTLLMKMAGIDGVVADWYGTSDVNDYGRIHRRTILLFQAIKRAGLKFAVCYEDRSLKAMVEAGKLAADRAVEQARRDLLYGAEQWFSDGSYVSWQGRPLVLIFGPDYLNGSQWEAVVSGLRPAPALVTLHERRAPAVGSYAWPPMWAAKHGVLDAKGLDGYFDRFERQGGLKIGGVFPGFHDFYQQAGVQPSYGFLDARDGETFRHTLKRALAPGSPILQIATWNDFGEGTTIEPTREYGNRHLEAIQAIRRGNSDGLFPYRPADLRLPLRIYRLRRSIAGSPRASKTLDAAVASLLDGEISRAVRGLDDLEKAGAGSQPGRE